MWLPQIMQAIVKFVLAADPIIAQACKSYYDDIIMDESSGLRGMGGPAFCSHMASSVSPTEN